MKYFAESEREIALTKECEKVLEELREEIRRTADPSTALYIVINGLVQHMLTADIVLALEMTKFDVLVSIFNRVRS